MTAADLMTRRVVTLRVGDGLRHAAEVLTSSRISGAPVVDDQRRVVGMLSQHDCIRAVLGALYHQAPPRHVADVMTRRVETVSSDETLLDLSTRFVAHRLRRLPVVDDHHVLLGQISRHDLLLVALTAFDPERRPTAPSLYLSALDATPPHAEPTTG